MRNGKKNGQLFKRLLKTGYSKFMNQQAITIVSGLPRSGTSLMMKMLDAGGLPLLTDHIREPNSDNPRGYYEFERVRKLDKGDHEWLKEAHGKAVKIISELLKYLPPGYTYKIIFMHRKLEEILASHQIMLNNRGMPDDGISEEEMKRLFIIHLNKIKAWLGTQPNISVIDVDYNQLLIDPQPYTQEINRFLDNRLSVENMSNVIDHNLYRNRR